MITHCKNNLVSTLLAHHARAMLQKNFRKISFTVSGAEPCFEPNVPVLAIANHAGWWDPMLAMHLSNHVFRKETYGVMAEEELRRYGIFRMVGVYSVDRSSPMETRRFLEYTRKLMAGTGRLLWIYPQGDIVSAEVLPLQFKGGFAHIARLLGRVHILKIVSSYDFWLESKPEIVIDILPLETLEAGSAGPAEQLTERIAAEMSEHMAAVRAIVRTRDASALRTVFVADRGTHPVYDMYRRFKAAFRNEDFAKRHGAH